MEYDIEATIEITIEANSKEDAEARFNEMLPMNSACEIHSVEKTKQP